MGFPGGSVGKNPPANARDTGLIPGSGRSPGEGIGYLLQCSWASLVAQMVKNLPEMQETGLIPGLQAPRRAVCGTRGSLRTMHGGGSAPSCCAFTHRVAFEEGSRPRVLLKGGPVNHKQPLCTHMHLCVCVCVCVCVCKTDRQTLPVWRQAYPEWRI